MTAHIKALPRLYDELNSSHVCVHGASAQALAIAYVQVNAATRFASSVTNNRPLSKFPLEYTDHKQPGDTQRVVEKIRELPAARGNPRMASTASESPSWTSPTMAAP